MTNREIDVVAAAAMVERGVLPDPGGWQDQPATFVQIYPIAAREIGHWQKVHRDLAMKKDHR